jgi:hypothetical protein
VTHVLPFADSSGSSSCSLDSWCDRSCRPSPHGLEEELKLCIEVVHKSISDPLPAHASTLATRAIDKDYRHSRAITRRSLRMVHISTAGALYKTSMTDLVLSTCRPLLSTFLPDCDVSLAPGRTRMAGNGYQAPAAARGLCPFTQSPQKLRASFSNHDQASRCLAQRHPGDRCSIYPSALS